MGSARTARRKVGVGLASLLLATAGVSYLSLTTTSTVGAALAGSTTLLDEPGEQVVVADPPCDWIGDNCRSYPLQLTEGTFFQAQLDNTTAYMTMALVNDLGTELDSRWIDAGESTYIPWTVETTGDYVLVVGSPEESTYDVYAFETPATLVNVSLPATIEDEFDKRTTRQASNKVVGYTDGVTFNGDQDQRVTLTFSKPGEVDSRLVLVDAFGDEVASVRGTEEPNQPDFLTLTETLPSSGQYGVNFEGTSQGEYTLTLVDPDAPVASPTPTATRAPVVTVPVTSVSLSKKKVKVRKGKKVTLRATVLPANATKKAVRWKSSKPKVASVRKGVVKGKRKGKAVIRVITVDGGKKATVKVKVRRR